MFEFITYPVYFLEAKTIVMDTTPIHVAAENMAVKAAALTVEQFNQACEAVCNEHT
jgi:hypothetical protein